jgi:hypothetical protein
MELFSPCPFSPQKKGKKAEFVQLIAEAQDRERGIWSLAGDSYVSAAEYKRRLRSEGVDPAATFLLVK